MIDRILTMAFRHALLFWFCIVVIYIPRITAQNISPTNSTTAPKERQFVLITSMAFNIDPLTDNAGLAGSSDQLKVDRFSSVKAFLISRCLTIFQKIQFRGQLVPATSPQDAASINQGDIALINCEPNAYNGPLGEGPQSASSTLNAAISRSPSAVVLYSTSSSGCSFSAANGFTFTYLYTTTDRAEFATIENTYPSDSSRIVLASLANTNNATDSTFTKSPTTAVAMIILYSITGIITALFLIIIIIGAIRAHRHPERYGPRHVIGRPRQSRAKGIARAMLETLPIVKFGDKDDKPLTHMELGAAGETTQDRSQAGQEPQGATADEPGQSNAVNSEPDLVKTERADGIINPQPGGVEDGMNAENGLACSVCTDDFVKGQDIRVLPCNHKFHPECIDPWLLNVSGTCPLWYVCKT